MSEKQSAAVSGGRELLVRLISGTATAPMAEQLTAAGSQWRGPARSSRERAHAGALRNNANLCSMRRECWPDSIELLCG